MSHTTEIKNSQNFVLDLHELCKQDPKSSKSWVLVLIDGNETEIPPLIQSEQKQNDWRNHGTMSPEQNERQIVTLKKYLSNISKQYSYHLGNRLFAIIINDTMDTCCKVMNQILHNLKDVIHFTLAIGMATLSHENVNTTNIGQLQRQWISTCYANVLRAKESGGNCFFNNEKKIDSSKNNVDLTRMTLEANKYYSNYSMIDCELIIYNVFDKFDEETILNQAITPDSILSVYFLLAKSVTYRRSHIGNQAYRAQKSFQLISTALQSFIRGNMTLECYYFYKSWQAEYWDNWQKSQNIKRPENKKSNKKDVLDIDTLTRKQALSKDIEEKVNEIFNKESTLYFAKLAFEHISDVSESAQITFDFAQEASIYSETENLGIDLFNQVIAVLTKEIQENPDNPKSHVEIAYPLSSIARQYENQGKYTEAFDAMSRALKYNRNNVWVLSSIALIYTNSVWDWDNDKMSESQRIDKAVEYYKQLMDVNIVGEKKCIRTEMYEGYAEILYCWTKDCDSNKATQATAAKMYEKAIKMDQTLGWDIINNWTRNEDKFPLELNSIIIEYWYYPTKRYLVEALLNYGDLIQTHFKDNKEKMKIGNIYCNIAGPVFTIAKSNHRYSTTATIEEEKKVNIDDIDSKSANDSSNDSSNVSLVNLSKVTNIRRIRSPSYDGIGDGDCLTYLSVSKPGKLNKFLAWTDYYDIRKEQLKPFGTIMHSYLTDDGGDGIHRFYDVDEDDKDKNKFKFTTKYAAKLAYFAAFVRDKDELDKISNGEFMRAFELLFGLRTDKDKESDRDYEFRMNKFNGDKMEAFRCLIAEMLMHGFFRLELASKRYANVYHMLVSSGFFNDLIEEYFDGPFFEADLTYTASIRLNCRNVFRFGVFRLLHNLCDEIYKIIDFNNEKVQYNIQSNEFLSPKIEIVACVNDDHDSNDDETKNDNDNTKKGEKQMYSMIREIFIDNKKLRNVFGEKEKYNENILMCSLIINDNVRRAVSNSSSMFAGDCLPFITRCIAKIYYHHG